MHSTRSARIMTALAVLALALAPHGAGADAGTGDGEPTTGVSACGVERWAVKTGLDADARLVDQTTIVPTNIIQLRTLPAPAQPPLRARVRPAETTVWGVDATLLRYKEEADSDDHLVLADTGGRTMIAELPAPECVGSGSPFLPAIRAVRRAFTARFHPTRSWQRVRVPMRVAGVGFFDFKHGQSGVAPNAIELHPVLGIGWTDTAAAAPSPPVPGAALTPVAPTPGPSAATGRLAVAAVVSPNPVAYGTRATLDGRSAIGAVCTASVIYATGRVPRSFDGGARTVGPSGRVGWTWSMESRGTGGTATVTCALRGRMGTATATFAVA